MADHLYVNGLNDRSRSPTWILLCTVPAELNPIDVVMERGILLLSTIKVLSRSVRVNTFSNCLISLLEHVFQLLVEPFLVLAT